MTIKGLIFDFDGTILETEMPEYESWRKIYSNYGEQLSIETFSKCLGASYREFDLVANLENILGRPLNREEMLAEQEKLALEKIYSIPPMPGVLDMLNQAKKYELKVGLASSSPRKWVEGHLSRLNLLSYFDCIYTMDDVDKVKPDPQLFIRTLKHLNLHPDEAIVLEDSPNGVIAAQAAGCFCIAIPNGISAHLNLDHANLVISSLEDVTLELLLKKLDSPVFYKN